ncbi:MAG: NUMOD4 domain-containing protein [bacterium]
MENNNEIWVDIIGYEGLYKISNYGNIKSCERYVEHKRHGQLLLREKLRKYGYGRDGRCNITLSKDGFDTLFGVARLVAIHFLDNPNNYEKVMHIDGNRKNNNVSNLIWISHRDVAIIAQSNKQKTSTINGVWFDKSKKKYCAAITLKGKQIRLGTFQDECKAKEAVLRFKTKNNIKTRFSYPNKF